MIKQITPILLAAGFLAACASTPSDEPKGAAKFAEDPRLGEKVDRICFNRTIDGFTHTDRDTVVVTARANDQYLLEVGGGCNNLRHAQSIGIDTSLSCVTRLDTIIVSTNPFSLRDNSIGPQRCFITGIYAWDEDAETEDDESEAETEIVAAP